MGSMFQEKNRNMSFDEKIKLARKSKEIKKENPVGLTGESKKLKRKTREGSREDKTGVVKELSLEAR